MVSQGHNGLFAMGFIYSCPSRLLHCQLGTDNMSMKFVSEHRFRINDNFKSVRSMKSCILNYSIPLPANINGLRLPKPKHQPRKVRLLCIPRSMHICCICLNLYKSGTNRSIDMLHDYFTGSVMVIQTIYLWILSHEPLTEFRYIGTKPCSMLSDKLHFLWNIIHTAKVTVVPLSVHEKSFQLNICGLSLDNCFLWVISNLQESHSLTEISRFFNAFCPGQACKLT